MYVDRKVFSKGEIYLQGHQVQSVKSATSLAWIHIINIF